MLQTLVTVSNQLKTSQPLRFKGSCSTSYAASKLSQHRLFSSSTEAESGIQLLIQCRYLKIRKYIRLISRVNDVISTQRHNQPVTKRFVCLIRVQIVSNLHGDVASWQWHTCLTYNCQINVYTSLIGAWISLFVYFFMPCTTQNTQSIFIPYTLMKCLTAWDCVTIKSGFTDWPSQVY